ncbi:MAG: hypothetical protein RQ754_16720 [Desulfuromonadales bacterium]|nr:hypothetical protein [Desulfuromonadales bacterium]
MKRLLCGLLLLAVLVPLTTRQADMLRQRPVELKLGQPMSSTLVRLFAGEHASTLALRNVVRVMFYFGSFFEDNPNRVKSLPEYANMYQHLVQAVRLDPYNMDAYYFAQAAFTWEVGRVREVNAMLDHGIKYRTNDYLLPFYAGFNAAYFLKDYAAAADYFQMAADRSGNQLFVRLASRYFHEAGRTDLGLAYLDNMIDSASDARTRTIYEQRRVALLAVQALEEAIDTFQERYARLPETLDALVKTGILAELPADPYGGSFYLDEDNRVRTTSKFAVRSEQNDMDSSTRPEEVQR